MPQEPKSRSPRVEINPKVWPALQVEAVIRRMSPKDLVNMLIIKNMSPKAHEFMESKPHDTAIPQPIATKEPMIPSPHEPLRRTATVADSIVSNDTNKPKRKSLEKDLASIEQIRELWTAGERNISKIAATIGYSRSTVGDHIKRMHARGELDETTK